MKICFSLSLSMMLCAFAVAEKHNENIPYFSPGSIGAVLDVHVPPSGVEAGVPTILFIHGGGWYSGDKTDSPALWMPLVDEGYGVVACNYTLSVDMSPSYPQAVHDVKAVVRWIRLFGAKEFNLSPTIAVMGPSAGGHLTEMLATTSGVETFEPLSGPIDGYAIQASIPFFGLCDFVMQVKEWEDTPPFEAFLGGPLNDKTRPTYVEASPRTWVTADDTPMFHVHGDDDPIHFPSQAIEMNAAMTDVGIHSEVHLYGGGHAFAEIEFGELEGYDAAVAILLEKVPTLLAAGRDGDINIDGFVDVTDLLAIISSWGECPELPVDCPADINGNGVVDVSDLLMLLAQWS